MTAAPGLQADVQLRDGGGNLVASAAATEPGGKVVLLPNLVSEGEAYTILVTNTIDSGGQDAGFSLNALLNVHFEDEHLGAPQNNDLQSAQLISEISHPLGNGEFVGILGSLSEGDEDWYQIELGEAQTVFLGMNWLTSPVNETALIELFDADGNRLGSSIDFSTLNLAAHYDTVNPFELGLYQTLFVRVTSDARQGDYRLLVMRDAVTEAVDAIGASQPLFPNVALHGQTSPGEDDHFLPYGDRFENWILQLNAPFAGAGEAMVPDSALPGSASRVFVEQIELNEGEFTPRGDEAVQLASLFGDATLNGDYSALDAALIARVAIGLDDGFAALPLIDPLLLGDVTGDGTLSALDASWVARKAVGLPQPEIPDPPAAKMAATLPVAAPNAASIEEASFENLSTHRSTSLFSAIDLFYSTSSAAIGSDHSEDATADTLQLTRHGDATRPYTALTDAESRTNVHYSFWPQPWHGRNNSHRPLDTTNARSIIGATDVTQRDKLFGELGKRIVSNEAEVVRT